jgi:hypothetical protein
MKRIVLLFVALFSILPGCSKKESTPASGIDTIDNTLYGTGPYYANGFIFNQAKKASTLDNPAPDITIDNDGTLLNLILQTNNYKESFYKVGEYADASIAEQQFISLTSYIVPQWVAWGYQIKPNQIWLFRTSNEHYAKIRIISTISEIRNSLNYAGCTFQWVYQPDGSSIFPGK